jgi:hypothetical protein
VISLKYNNIITIEIDFLHEIMFQRGFLYWVMESLHRITHNLVQNCYILKLISIDYC